MVKNEKSNEDIPVLLRDVQSKIIVIREQNVIVDADVACLYGVETKRINEAVRNNPDKFPSNYMFQLSSEETQNLRTKFSSTKFSAKSRCSPKVFTEKGLYMLATVLKSKKAVDATFAIIETFALVRTLKRELVNIHNEPDKDKQVSIMKNFGNVLSEVVMPDLETTETESSLELNFFYRKTEAYRKKSEKALNDIYRNRVRGYLADNHGEYVAGIDPYTLRNSSKQEVFGVPFADISDDFILEDVP